MDSPSLRIVSFLCKFPTGEFAYRELERGSGVSVATVSRCVKSLEAEGLVRTRRTTTSILVSAQLESDRFIRLKRVRNLEALYESGLVDHLARALRPDALVLFGSYSKGFDQEGSDIDIAVICGREAETDLKAYEDELGRAISLTRLDGLGGSSREFRNALANGIVLSGSLEVA